jgi:hypothetical protein
LAALENLSNSVFEPAPKFLSRCSGLAITKNEVLDDVNQVFLAPESDTDLGTAPLAFLPALGLNVSSEAQCIECRSMRTKAGMRDLKCARLDVGLLAHRISLVRILNPRVGELSLATVLANMRLMLVDRSSVSCNSVHDRDGLIAIHLLANS